MQESPAERRKREREEAAAKREAQRAEAAAKREAEKQAREEKRAEERAARESKPNRSQPAKDPMVTNEPPAIDQSDGQSNETSTFSLAILQKGCPDGVDPKAKELALDESEFEKALGHTKEQFFKLPKWKQNSAKRKAKIF